MKSLLICHEGATLPRESLARWLASFTELAGILVIRESRQRQIKRIKREIARVGCIRFLDVLAFRLYNELFLASRDNHRIAESLRQITAQHPPIPDRIPARIVASPNSDESEAFIRSVQPDFALARCKTLLSPRIFNLPRAGTYVLHPGICPEYRNSHGCFWALAEGDLKNVGATLLKIDSGVDTGPVYGYFTYPFDESAESHNVIQARVVTENLRAIAQKFEEIIGGQAQPIAVTGRRSAAYGQPWLTKYLRWKRDAKRRQRQQGLQPALS